MVIQLGLAAVLIISASISTSFQYRVVLRSVGFATLWTYVFWGTLSLLNFSALGIFAMPVFFAIGSDSFVRFFPFLETPLALGLMALALSCMLARLLPVRMRENSRGAILLVLSLNVVFLSTLVATASFKANEVISTAATSLHPICIYREPFSGSVLSMGDSFFPHAIVRSADGSNYYWSYSQQQFFKGNPQLDQNFDCGTR